MANINERFAGFERTSSGMHSNEQQGWQHASTEGYKPGALIHRLESHQQAQQTVNQHFGHVELFDSGSRQIAAPNPQGNFGSWHRQESQTSAPTQHGGFGSWHNGGMAAPSEQNTTLGHTLRRTFGTETGHVLYSTRR